MIYLGIDTSNYTTSVAAYGGGVFENIRKLLSVKQGERGLRQSDAVFQHLKAFPDLFSELSEKVDFKNVKAIGVSTRPRSVEGSYMPVFLAGEGYAKVTAKSLGVPLYTFSHQDGHIMAGIVSCNSYELLKKKFISVHLSGGTSEILLTEFNGYNFSCDIIGGTKDISAGQLIDRVGVKMGLKFPCGKELEVISQNAQSEISLPVNVSDGYFNFSGIETKTLSLVEETPNPTIAKSLFISISKALVKALEFLAKKYNIEDILIVGGVASNEIIKSHMTDNLSANIHFASAKLSTDNAIGIAKLTEINYNL